MKKDAIHGAWILEKRNESPEQGNSFTISEREYEFDNPEIEVLFFDSPGIKCYQIGIEERSLEDRKEYDYDVLYEDTAFIPGAYDQKNRTIEIIEKEKFEILSNGKLHIIGKQDDYESDEIWNRIPHDRLALQSYVESLIKGINESDTSLDMI